MEVSSTSLTHWQVEEMEDFDRCRMNSKEQLVPFTDHTLTFKANNILSCQPHPPILLLVTSKLLALGYLSS